MGVQSDLPNPPPVSPVLYFNIILHDDGSNIVVAGTLLSTKLQTILGDHQFFR